MDALHEKEKNTFLKGSVLLCAGFIAVYIAFPGLLDVLLKLWGYALPFYILYSYLSGKSRKRFESLKEAQQRGDSRAAVSVTYTAPRGSDEQHRQQAVESSSSSLFSMPLSGSATPSSASASTTPRVENPEDSLPPIFPLELKNCYDGSLLQPNSRQPLPLETDLFKGVMVMKLRSNPIDPYFEPYFRGRKRTLELQVQGKFKKRPDGPVFMGLEVTEQLSLGILGRSLMHISLGIIKSMTQGMHYSFGNKSAHENPHIMFPLSVMVDHLVITPPGGTPPEIGVPELPNCPDKANFNADPNSFWDPENTYSVSFHDMYLDFVGWKAGNIPGGMSDISFTTFIKSLPLKLVAYELRTKEKTPKVHAEEDKNYIFNLELKHLGGSNVTFPTRPPRVVAAAEAPPAKRLPQVSQSTPVMLATVTPSMGSRLTPAASPVPKRLKSQESKPGLEPSPSPRRSGSRKGRSKSIDEGEEGGLVGEASDAEGAAPLESSGREVEASFIVRIPAVIELGSKSCYKQIVFVGQHLPKHLSPAPPPTADGEEKTASMLGDTLPLKAAIRSHEEFVKFFKMRKRTFEKQVKRSRSLSPLRGQQSDMELVQKSYLALEKKREYLEHYMNKTIKDETSQMEVLEFLEDQVSPGTFTGSFLAAKTRQEYGLMTEKRELKSAYKQQKKDQKAKPSDTLFSGYKLEQLSRDSIVLEGVCARALWETNWREEWCVLYNKCLLFYFGKHRRPQFMIPLADITAVSTFPQSFAAKDSSISFLPSLPAAIDLSSVVMKGFLKVRGSFRVWHTRWFVLIPGQLLYYSNDKTSKLYGRIKLDGCEVLQRSSKKHGFGMQINHRQHKSIYCTTGLKGETLTSAKMPGRQDVCILRAGGEAEGQRWLEALESCCVSTEMKVVRKKKVKAPGLRPDSTVDSEASGEMVTENRIVSPEDDIDSDEDLSLCELEDFEKDVVGSIETKKPFCGYYFVQVETCPLVFYLCFPSSKEQAKWVHAIQSAKNDLEAAEPAAQGSTLTISEYDPRKLFVQKGSVRWKEQDRIVLNCRRMMFNLFKTHLSAPDLSAILLEMVLALNPDSPQDLVAEFLDATSQLKIVKISNLNGEEALAFFINIYHVLLLHGFLVLGPPDTAVSKQEYYANLSYEVSGILFSLNEIESILRGGAAAKVIPNATRLSADNPRAKFCLKQADRRLSFVLNYGTRAFPATIPVLHVNTVHDQLDEACRTWVAHCLSVEFGPQRGGQAGVVRIAENVRWLMDDFELQPRDTLAFLIKFMKDEWATPLGDLLAANKEVEFVLSPFDWNFQSTFKRSA
eukprot:CAMPEP_0177680652 /NCGR_PEP_ID=MMETSP0447-20121125/30289_1 /TAXON_ID=0 /ORGANISM="Stygamoeba regulata, Strain BSH-02190019" /LENGTH=1306 /DNA_ID=CAMNT_0019190001 /DNA_START=99 /DNA_END=4019 /DNA_ORIENTATION=-